MWRDADTEARDLKSNAVVARDVRDNRLVVEGAESLALRALAAALRVWRDCGGVPDGTDEIFTIRLPARAVNAGMKTPSENELPRPSRKCDFELRGGAVKAVARRVERSESLDDAEHSSILIVVMADFWRQ